jgi:hypothetical protein
MNTARADLPTLTEVVDLTPPTKARPVEPGDESPDFEATVIDPSAGALPPLAYDEDLVAQVMVRLQPRLEAWVEAQVRRALLDMLPVWTESAALTIVRDLRAEMPELLSVALDEVHRQRRGG